MADSRLVLRSFIRAFLLLILSAPLITLLLAFQSSARVAPGQALSSEEISQVESLIVANAPGNVDNASLQSVSLSESELNLLLRYGLELLDPSQRVGGHVALTGQGVRAEFSIPLTESRFPVWLNLGAEFANDPDQLALDSLQLGILRIPASSLTRLLNQIRRSYLVNNQAYNDLVELAGTVHSITVQDEKLKLDLLWEPELIARISDQARYYLVSSDDQQRITRHYQLLHDVLANIPESTRAISLNTLLVPLFSAAEQHTAAGADPIAENRTLLMTLAMYVNNEDVEQLLGTALAANLPRARQIEVRVQRRQDLAQHIASSAAIAASAGAGLAEVLSSTKEAYDARYRSGYSFSDLTANSAGVALGRAATASVTSARVMQYRLANLKDETEYLPSVDSNQDGLTEADFNRLYRENNEEYQRRIDEIENLIYSLPLFSNL